MTLSIVIFTQFQISKNSPCAYACVCMCACACNWLIFKEQHVFDNKRYTILFSSVLSISEMQGNLRL